MRRQLRSPAQAAVPGGAGGLSDNHPVGPGKSSLRAEALDPPQLALGLKAEPAGLERQGRTVGKAHEARGEILDVDLLVVPVAPAAGDVRALGQFCVDKSRDRDGFGIAHEPASQVEYV